MAVPLMRGFSSRAWIARGPNGDLGLITDEREAEAYAAKPGWQIGEYSFIRELRVDRAAANEPPWDDEDLVEEQAAPLAGGPNAMARP